MVLGQIINQVQDASGKITISVWKTIDIVSGHHDFQVDVGDEWVCIGGGATGRKREYVPGSSSPMGAFGLFNPGNYLTGSLPSQDDTGQANFKGWRILSKDHIDQAEVAVIGYAIGMKHGDLNKQELISNLTVFRDVGMAVPHPQLRVYVDQGFLLLGGGFHVLDQQGGGNIVTASFPDSTISWRARSQDILIPTPSRLEVFAIGIRENLKKPNPTGPSIGNVVTSFSSDEKLNPAPGSLGSFSPDSIARPLPGFALCGGGGAAHPTASGSYLYALEPPTLENPPAIPPPKILDPFFEQTFTTRSTSYNELHTNTAYAMGIKFVPTQGTTPPSPTPPSPTPPSPIPSTACNNKLIVRPSTSSPSQPTFTVTDAIDDNPATKWMSTFIPKPFITLDLTAVKPICRVDITWADADTSYHFEIGISNDNTTFTQVYSGARTGTTVTPETYPFGVTQARYVRITVTRSIVGTDNVLAQIAEIAVYSNT